jgi:transcription initiation factor TFIID subunit 5
MSAPALTERDAVAEYNSNAAGPHLKLGGQVPLSERLKKEVEREIKEEDMREEAARQKKEQEDKGGEAAPPADADAMKVDAPSAGADGTATGAAAAASPNTAGDKAGTPSRESARPSPGPGRASTVAPTTAPATTTTVSSGLLQPEFTDLPPQPPLFRSVDVDREVSRIRDARKALRLGEAAAVTPAGDDVRTAALPSVCSFTYHDAEDG